MFGFTEKAGRVGSIVTKADGSFDITFVPSDGQAVSVNMEAGQGVTLVYKDGQFKGVGF